MSDLTHRRSTAVSAPRPASRGRLMTTVAVSALAALAVFTMFWVIGAVVGLAVVAAAVVALVVGGVWAMMKFGRGKTRSVREPPPPMP